MSLYNTNSLILKLKIFSETHTKFEFNQNHSYTYMLLAYSNITIVHIKEKFII